LIVKRRYQYLSGADAELIWTEWRKGQTTQVIGAMLAQPGATVRYFLARHGGIVPRPRRRSTRALSLAEREEISRGVGRRESCRAIARRLGRAPSSVSREIRRHGGAAQYRALAADEAAWQRAARPKRCRLALFPRLQAAVAAKLQADWSPQQIAAWLVRTYPDDPTMHVSHETIYRTLYVQARGALKKELAQHLRRRRVMRRSRAATTRGHGQGQLIDVVPISERPPIVTDRAVPGHWEGDLLLGAKRSQVATLVERQSRFVMLVRTPERDTTTVVRALSHHVKRLPARLRQSLTWDRGKEMAQHKEFTIATDVKVYFCDPRSPWQRGSNENTNGLLRQYFPKGMDLSNLTQRDLDSVALKLNTRPRLTLNWKTPAYVLATAVASTD
jgi:IS30 family transposase